MLKVGSPPAVEPGGSALNPSRLKLLAFSWSPAASVSQSVSGKEILLVSGFWPAAVVVVGTDWSFLNICGREREEGYGILSRTALLHIPLTVHTRYNSRYLPSRK